MRPHSSPDSSSLSTIFSTISATDLTAMKTHRASAPGDLGRKHHNHHSLGRNSSSPHSSPTLQTPSTRASSFNSSTSSQKSVLHNPSHIPENGSSTARNKELKNSHTCVALDFRYQNIYASGGAGKKSVSPNGLGGCYLM